MVMPGMKKKLVLNGMLYKCFISDSKGFYKYIEAKKLCFLKLLLLMTHAKSLAWNNYCLFLNPPLNEHNMVS